MAIDLIYDSDPVPAAAPADAGDPAADPAQDLPYRLSFAKDLDIDYFEVNGPCFVPPYLNKLTFGIGTPARNFNDMLLVAQGPGYAHDDERALLKWLRWRVSGMGLAMRLMTAGVERVTLLALDVFNCPSGTLREKLILTTVQVANVVVIEEDNVEMDGVGAAGGSETDSEDGQEAVIDVDEDENRSENDLDVPATDAANNDVDGDHLYIGIFDNIGVTQKRTGFLHT
eukprot:jgi/Phyca11/15820/fgenesh1_pg.PHYCAscaffold_15_\